VAMRVAVLGTGIMGGAMARNIARAGHEVVAWNRTREKAEPLRDDGVEVVDSPGAATDGADVVLTMLADGPAVEQVARDAIDGDLLWIQSSTVGIEWTERLAKLAAERGVEFVDAPVTGTKQPAEEGKLVVLASGPESIRERCEPIFDAIGSRTLWLGEAGTGTRVKLVSNSWLVSLTEAVAETLALAEATGVDPKLFLELIQGGPLDFPYAQLKGKMIVERDFEVSFPLELAAKDARLALEAAERAGIDPVLLRAVAERMRQATELGHGRDDMAATWYATAPDTARSD
jgi:3-hydroxyisobutyrate dehydrogenase